MVLKVRIKVERIDGLPIGEYTAIVNSGFSGRKCEVLIPGSLINVNLLSQVSNPAPTSKLSGGGTSIPLIRYSDAVNVYIIGDDRVEGPVKSDVLISDRAKYVLLNDKLTSMLKIVIIDPSEGLWCFRDELGVRFRRGI